jgi:hypothetical protein
MPTELRHVLFKPAEVVEALVLHRRRTGEPLPSGSIVACGVEQAGPAAPVGFHLAVERDCGGPDARYEVRVEGPELCAALLLYCRERRVPMPAKADKSLQRFGSRLGLVITFNPHGEEVPQTSIA